MEVIELPSVKLNRGDFINRPEGLELRLSSSLEDLIPEDERSENMSEDHDPTLYLIMKYNHEINYEIDQLNAKIQLLQEQKEVNNVYIYQNCSHDWIKDGYDPGSGRSYKVCKHCHLSNSARFRYDS